GQDAHIPVPEANEMLGQAPCPGGVIDGDAADIEGGTADGDDAAAAFPERAYSRRHAPDISLVGQARTRDDDGAGAVGLQEPEVLQLLINVPVGIADGDKQACGRGCLVHAVDDLGEVGIADITHQNSYRVVPEYQPLCLGI